MTHRTDPREWTVPRFDAAVADIVSDLLRAADRIQSIGTRDLQGDQAYFKAASSIQHELRSLAGNLGTDSLYRAAFDVETITVESMARMAEEARRADAAKTYQWHDGEEWYEVHRYNTSGSSRSHYFVRGAGQGDGAICGKATYAAGYRSEGIKPLCKRCEGSVQRR